MASSKIPLGLPVKMMVYSIATGSSISLTFGSYNRSMLWSSSYNSTGTGLYATYVTSSGTSANLEKIHTPSNLAVSSSGHTLTIANTSGSQVHVLLAVLSGDLPTAS